MPFLILGEVLVDLICEQPADGIGDATAFTPRFGGAAANAAVSAARAGGRPALGGGAGQDPWGQWLLERLRGEGVDTRWSTLDQGRQTPVAFATIAGGGQLTFAIYGEGISAALVAFEDRVISTIGAGDAFFGTLLAGLQGAGWNPAAPPVRDALAAAAEAGARAMESWGAVA